MVFKTNTDIRSFQIDISADIFNMNFLNNLVLLSQQVVDYSFMLNWHQLVVVFVTFQPYIQGRWRVTSGGQNMQHHN